jgi:hypothetical protein
LPRGTRTLCGMRIKTGEIEARCPLCHHTNFQRVRDNHPSLPVLMMCAACGTETAYPDLVAQLADVSVNGRSEGVAETRSV